jgi:hypothetical protein
LVGEGDRDCNLTSPKPREKSFLIPLTLVYVILIELEKIEDKYKKKTIRAIIRSSKRDNMGIISNFLHNTQQRGNRSSLRK